MGQDNMFDVGQDWISGWIINHTNVSYPTKKEIKQFNLKSSIILFYMDGIE